MNYVKIIIFLLCCFGNTAVFAQKTQFKKADKAYKAKNYSEAIPLYEEGLAIKDNLSRRTKLANSYRMINQLDKAATIFREVVRDPKAKPITYFYLGESLMGAGNYDEAKYWFQQYHVKQPEDQKALLMIAACDQVKDIKSIFPDMGVLPFVHNTDVDDNAPIFWKNQIIYSSDRNQGIKLLKQKSAVTGRDYIQIYSATEESNFNYSDPKSYSGKVNELNKNSSNISISEDGTRAIFSRNSKDANKKNTHTIQLFEMSSTDGNKWKNVRPVDFSNNAYNFMHPALSPDGNTLFFVSDKGSGLGGTDIYVSYYKKEKWSRPVNLGPVINTDANEGFPFFDKDGKLFFCSKGHAGLGGFDIFFSIQNPETEQWAVPINVGAPINSPSDDISIFIDYESRRTLFTSSRDGGDDDIYLGWLDGLPEGLKAADDIVSSSTPKPEAPSKITEKLHAATETNTIPDDSKIETDIAAKVDVDVEKVKTEEAAKTENTTVVSDGETMPESPAVDPVVTDIMEETTEIIIEEAVTVPAVTTAEAVPEVIKTEEVKEIVLSEKIVEVAPTTTDEVLPKLTTEEKIEPVRKTEAEVPASPAVVEEVIETAEDLIPPVPVEDIPATEAVIPEPTVEVEVETTEKTEVPATARPSAPTSTKMETDATNTVNETIKKDNKKKPPVVEKSDQPNPSTAKPASPASGTSSVPDPISITEDNLKESLSPAVVKERSSFSTLKKDIKKKRSTAGKIYRLKNISYDPGGYLVAEAHGEALDDIYEIMKQDQNINIELASHTYSVGLDQNNLRLSQNRAKRAALYLVEKGISSERIFAVGYGETQILNHCANGVACTQAEHAVNERLEIRIIDEAH